MNPHGEENFHIIQTFQEYDDYYYFLNNSLPQLERTESRVFVLYCTRREARELVRMAKSLGLTRKEFVWIATQPVIGPDLEAPLDLVPGMLGVHFDTKNVSECSMMQEMM